MTIRIGSNLASLNAQRRLGEASSSLGTSYERLASGQRINRASDDAAGLAIADDLKTKGRIYTQAIRNGNDGISYLNIADSAIAELSGIVVRIRELSEQSANGSYSNQQRKALDAEAQALSKEFTRITQTTTFNNRKVFSGGGGNVTLQLGQGENSTLNASIGGAVGTGKFNLASIYTSEHNYTDKAVTLIDLNGDSILDMVTAGAGPDGGKAMIRLGLGDGSFGEATSYTTAGSRPALHLGDLNGDGILDMVTAGYEGYASQATIRLGLGDGSFGEATSYTTEDHRYLALSLGDLNGDGILDMVTAGEAYSGGVTVRLGLGDSSFGEATSYAAGEYSSSALYLGDLNQDGILDMVTAGSGTGSGEATVRLGLGDGNFGAATSCTTESGSSRALYLGDLNGDGILDMVTAGGHYSSGGKATVRLGLGNGQFGDAVTYSTTLNASTSVMLGDLNGDGILDMVVGGNNYSGPNYGTLAVRLGKGDGSFGDIIQTEESNYVNQTALGDVDGDGVLDIVVAKYNSGVSVLYANTTEGLGALQELSLKTAKDSRAAMSILDKTLQNLAKQRGTIGASQSRINIALNNLQSARENFNAAESRIRDADIAQESALLARTQILQQAAVSVLSQANQSPSLALKLLS